MEHRANRPRKAHRKSASAASSHLYTMASIVDMVAASTYTCLAVRLCTPRVARTQNASTAAPPRQTSTANSGCRSASVSQLLTSGTCRHLSPVCERAQHSRQDRVLFALPNGFYLKRDFLPRFWRLSLAKQSLEIIQIPPPIVDISFDNKPGCTSAVRGRI